MTAVEVELKERPQLLTDLGDKQAVVDFTELFVDNIYLLGTLAQLIYQGGIEARDRDELFRWIFSELGKKQAIVDIARRFDGELAKLPAGAWDDNLLAPLILECVTCVYLERRLGNELKRDVQIWVKGNQIPPTRNDLDCGCARPAPARVAEFYECKIGLNRLFEGKQGQLTLMLNAQSAISGVNWSVVCAVTTLITHHRAVYVLSRHQKETCGLLEPVGLENLGQLSHQAPPF